MNYYDIQAFLFISAIVSSIIFLLAHARKRQVVTGLFMFILPFLIYFFINFTVEAALFGIWLYNNAPYLSLSVFHTANKNLSLCDLKITLPLIALVGWFYVYFKYDKHL